MNMIDGHNDLPWAMRKLCEYDLDIIDLGEVVPRLHTDIPRLHAGGVTGQFWSVYVPSNLPAAEAVVATLEQIEFVHRMVRRFPGDLALATTADEVMRVCAEGRIASLIGMEGGHSIGNSLAVLRMMYDLGARYMTLTHNDNTDWADSATDHPVHGGLSAFGEDVVREMNRIGMLVDLSHVSTEVMRQAMVVSSAPVMFSHSSARALCDVARNVPDDVLTTLRGNGGLCMVTFVPEFLVSTADEGSAELSPFVATIDHVVAHLQHVREVAGIDHVGIGGDFDGTATVTQGLHDVSCYPALFDALRMRHWSAADRAKLATTNALRVLRAAQETAHR